MQFLKAKELHFRTEETKEMQKVFSSALFRASPRRVFDFFADRLTFHGDRPFTQGVSYKSLMQQVQQKINQWQTPHADDRADGRVLIRGPNSTAFIANVLASWAVGKVPVLIGPHVSETYATTLLDRDPGCTSESLIVFTSGTGASQPKGVRLSSDNVISHTLMLREHVSEDLLNMHDRTVSVLPWTHCYGLLGECFSVMYRGAYTLPIAHPQQLFGAIHRVQPTVLFAVPRMLDVWSLRNQQLRRWMPIRTLRRMTLFGTRLRFVVSGGAKLSNETRLALSSDLDLRIYQGYGCTEMSPMIALQTSPFHGGVGPALPGVQIDLSPNNEILVNGPNRFLGYLGEPSLDQSEPYATGDSGAFLKNECLHISGRIKDTVKVASGRFVSLTELEQWSTRTFPRLQHASFWERDGRFEGAIQGTGLQSGDVDELRRALKKTHNVDLHNIAVLERPLSVQDGTLSIKGEPRRSVIQRLCCQPTSLCDKQ